MTLTIRLLVLGFFLGGLVTSVAATSVRRQSSFRSVIALPVFVAAPLVLCDCLVHVWPWQPALGYVSALTAFSMGGQNVLSARAARRGPLASTPAKC